MRVLLTGAAGNLGSETLPYLLERNHQVRTFDLDRPQNRGVLERYGNRIERVWGDITQPADVARAVLAFGSTADIAADGPSRAVEAVLHNAAVTPPLSELKPELARQVNVDGTRNLIDALKAKVPSAKLLFTSSIATFGVTQPGEAPPRRADSTLSESDHYSAHKIACEALLRASGLVYCIMRIGASPPINPQGGDPSLLRFMFERSLDSRVEYVHPRDVGLAQARALEVAEAWNKVLLIGGGKACQITNRELINGLFDAIGIGALPERAFGPTYLYGDWLDTEESQRLLDYQHHTYQQFLTEVSQNLGFKRLGVGLMRPFVRRFLLRYSAAYKAQRA